MTGERRWNSWPPEGGHERIVGAVDREVLAGPLLLALLDAKLRHVRGEAARARLFGLPPPRSAAEATALQGAPARAAAGNAAWALGTPDAVKQTSKWELDQLAPEELSPGRPAAAALRDRPARRAPSDRW